MNTGVKVTTVGIVGLGSFGAFAATLLPKDVRLIGYDADPERRVAGLERVEFTRLSEADMLVVAVPLEDLPSVLGKLSKIIRPQTLVIDVCSVKVKPQQAYEKYLPGHQAILLTHPLFGPQSAATRTKDHQLIITKSEGEKAAKVVAFCQQKLELKVTHMSAEAHDKIMARVHALTFFVARGLANMNLENEVFMTPSYKMLTDLVKLDRSHSQQLFQTLENGNPFAAAAHQELLESFEQVEASLRVRA